MLKKGIAYLSIIFLLFNLVSCSKAMYNHIWLDRPTTQYYPKLLDRVEKIDNETIEVELKIIGTGSAIGAVMGALTTGLASGGHPGSIVLGALAGAGIGAFTAVGYMDYQRQKYNTWWNNTLVYKQENYKDLLNTYQNDIYSTYIYHATVTRLIMETIMICTEELDKLTKSDESKDIIMAKYSELKYILEMLSGFVGKNKKELEQFEKIYEEIFMRERELARVHNTDLSIRNNLTRNVKDTRYKVEKNLHHPMENTKKEQMDNERNVKKLLAEMANMAKRLKEYENTINKQNKTINIQNEEIRILNDVALFDVNSLIYGKDSLQY